LSSLTEIWRQLWPYSTMLNTSVGMRIYHRWALCLGFLYSPLTVLNNWLVYDKGCNAAAWKVLLS
jgi:hypothetical protein